MTEMQLVGGRELQAKLKALPDRVKRRLRVGLKAAGEEVAAEARANAHWSSRIPGAIRIRVSASTQEPGVRVIVDHVAAPHARVLELGNVGRRGDTFRHPVFGRTERDWASQDRRPFLFPAAKAKRPAVLEHARKAVRSALAE